MNKSELLSIIQSELASNPQATSIDIAKKHKIPLIIVEIFKRRIATGQ